ncbi:beta-galactosidase GalB [Flavimarina sp. Hel_I_48]|uniref:beta-galactosidase GalB n=1 Tax=Flavimarina sp. Hel_I_48 TaxID=1392488 RepID=UPI0004DF3603|nr:beta-galactosidase GalB [Flavimarina sp. Hel_I_48]
MFRFFRHSLTLSIIFAVSISFSQTKKSDFSRRTKDFNANWQFHLNDDLQNQDTISANTSWNTLNLPHDWSVGLPFEENSPSGAGGGSLRGGLGWYKKTFQVPAADSSKITKIIFDGVYHNSSVWINGNFLGKRPNGYIGFEYDLTPFLKYGDTNNEILIKVDNAQQPNSRWYSGSGIYRNVWLTTTNKLRVPQWGTFITTPHISTDSASVKIVVQVENGYKTSKTAQIRTKIVYKHTKIASISSENTTILAHKSDSLRQEISIPDPELWSVDNPAMYTAVTEIVVDGKIVDQYKTPFGIRNFKFDLDRGFILNGKQVKIKGVCMHHDLGPLGAAVNTRAIERQLEILKDMGVNGIRTAHNPPAPELLELCDAMGFIVMDESFDIWEKNKTEFDYANNWGKWHKTDLKDQIFRDRNHPSVFMWSIGNEIPEQWSNRGAVIGRELAAIVKSLDTTRLVTAGMNPPIHIKDKEVTIQFEETAAEPNALAGSGALDIIGYNYAHQTYAQHQKNFPNTPFIATETTSSLETRGYYEFPSDTTKIWPVRWDIPFSEGSPANRISAFDQVRAPWGSLHETTWKIIKKYDFLSGFYIWTGFDYIGEPTPYTWPSRSSYFGIIDLAGFPKDVYYMYKSEWVEEDVLHLLPHWNWEKGQTVDVWAYYNHADEVELFLNGKSMGTKKKQGEDLHVMWRFPFEAGTLKAISRKAGKTIKETEVKTAGNSTKMALTADRNTIIADGKDLSFITVTITDDEGILSPRANDNITFSIEGNGEIVGVASGDPTNHQSFKGKEHRALNGKCLVILQSAKDAGTITLTAKASGLKTATINIISE